MRVFTLALLVLLSASGASAQDSSKATIRRFFDLRERMLDQRGTEKDVADLVALFSKDGQYEHPGFGVSMDMSQARRGMLSHLNEGRDATITIKRAKITDGFAVIETTLDYLIPDGKKDQKVHRASASVFELKDGKILHLREY